MSSTNKLEAGTVYSIAEFFGEDHFELVLHCTIGPSDRARYWVPLSELQIAREAYVNRNTVELWSRHPDLGTFVTTSGWRARRLKLSPIETVIASGHVKTIHWDLDTISLQESPEKFWQITNMPEALKILSEPLPCNGIEIVAVGQPRPGSSFADVTYKLRRYTSEVQSPAVK